MGPLHGLKVVELGRYIAAPLAGRLLADWGAEVVKVEAPEGDPIRWGPGGNRPGFSPVFAAYNKGKRSVTLDLKQESGKDVLRRLLANSDAFIHNLRPAALARLGIAPHDLLEVQPGLIVCGINGFGSDGPYAETPSFDAMVSGIGGLMTQLGPAGSPPVGPSFADILTGMYSAQAVLAGLVARGSAAANGRGQVVDVSMISALVNATDDAFTTWFEAGADLGTRSRQARQQVFMCHDVDSRQFVVQVTSAETVWRKFVELVDPEGLGTDPRFETYPLRIRHFAELSKAVSDSTRSRTREQWLSLLDELGICAGPVNTVSEAATDPRLDACGVFTSIPMSEGEPMRSTVPPGRFRGTPPGPLTAPPDAGEHTVAVLDELGIDGDAREEVLAVFRMRRQNR